MEIDPFSLQLPPQCGAGSYTRSSIMKTILFVLRMHALACGVVQAIRNLQRTRGVVLSLLLQNMSVALCVRASRAVGASGGQALASRARGADLLGWARVAMSRAGARARASCSAGAGSARSTRT